MTSINKRSLTLPSSDLIPAINEANERKRETHAARDREYGAGRIHVGSYMENIALPDLFGYDMNDYFDNFDFAFETELRYRLFMLDNVLNDGLQELNLTAESSYYDMTLFGLVIDFTRDGVPNFRPHALANDFDLSLIKPFDFFETGEMPRVHKRYEAYKRISNEKYGGAVKVRFPFFVRGPLDIVIQLLGYENFIYKCAEEPDKMRELFTHIMNERTRYNELAAAYINEPVAKRTRMMADDWVNSPFINPSIFDTFAAPAYRFAEEHEGPVRFFHTCGTYGALLDRLTAAIPHMEVLDVSSWNDPLPLSDNAPSGLAFVFNLLNTLVLHGTEEEQLHVLRVIKKVSANRKVHVNAAAIVNTCDSHDETIARTNAFIELAQKTLNE